jgi:RNA polymerase sigma factor (sigma-70 family)
MGNVEVKDDRLWLQSLKGDGEAFGALFDRHHDRVFRHAYRLSGDRHDPEDIMSPAFLELWRRRGKVRIVEGSVLPWLLVTTTNVARNSGRAAKRYRGLLNSLPRNAEAQHIRETSYVQDTVDKDVALALGTLNATDLRLVSLVVFEDYSLADAGAVLKLTPGAAKTRMHRARQRMKAAINGPAGATPAAVVERELP